MSGIYIYIDIVVRGDSTGLANELEMKMMTSSISLRIPTRTILTPGNGARLQKQKLGMRHPLQGSRSGIPARPCFEMDVP